MYDDVVD